MRSRPPLPHVGLMKSVRRRSVFHNGNDAHYKFMSPVDKGTPPIPCSEWAATPEAVIVHDPVAAGAFDDLAADTPPENFLFRAHPQAAAYAAQHAAFREALRRHVPVYLLSELVGTHMTWRKTGRSPNQVFTRDSLITLPWVPSSYIRARMKPMQRREESETMAAAVRRLSLTELVRLPEDIFLEGGDVVPFMRKGCRTLLVGYGPRSTRAGARFLRDTLVPAHLDEVIAIELADWRMNLDGGFLPVAGDVVLTERESILRAEVMDKRGEHERDLWAMLDGMGMHVIGVTREESIHRQACNAVCLGTGALSAMTCASG